MFDLIPLKIREEKLKKIHKCFLCGSDKMQYTYRHICRDCDFAMKSNEKLHEKYLAIEKKRIEKLNAKRQYVKGNPITTFDELLKQDLVFMYGRPMTSGVVLSQQFRVIVNMLASKSLFYAVKKQKENCDELTEWLNNNPNADIAEMAAFGDYLIEKELEEQNDVKD